MRSYQTTAVTLSLVLLVLSGIGRAENSERLIKKAAERSTLNQEGTKPFHLYATLAPTKESDKASNRNGTIEIWWVSPSQWRREVRAPEFHQVAVVNKGREWQKNEGDYFPEWLRMVSVALIDPVPNLDQVMAHVRSGEEKKLMGSTYFQWIEISTNGEVQKGMGGTVAITDSTGFLFYAGGLGWGGLYHDYKDFHGRMVARTVSSGSPEVTAKVTTLEDLGQTAPDFFDAAANVGDAQQLHTEIVEESLLRKNLVRIGLPVWPPLQDGPLEGALTTEVVVDRLGRVREVGTIVTDNPGVREAAREAILGMQFNPYLDNGVAVQVLSRITMSFKTVRPTGQEAFDSARSYFERGRKACFPAAGSGPPYLLEASFKAKIQAGTVEEGRYADTWESDTNWRREASIGQSRYVRARHGEKRYELSEGPDVALLKIVLRIMEPIPATDTLVESDWKIKRATIDQVATIRVLAGYESPDGTLDPEQARAFWFDENGKLIKAYFKGIETQRSNFQEFDGMQVAHEIKVLRNGALAMLIQVTQVAPAGTVPEKTFELKGHEWTRAFTTEVR